MRSSTIVLLVILLIIVIVAGFFVINPEAGQDLLVALNLAEPVASDYVVSGILEAQVVVLSSQSGGYVIEYLVMEGQSVSQAQWVAQLDTEALKLQRDAAQARYQAALAQKEIVESGARAVDLQVAQAAVDLAQAILGTAQLSLEDAEDISTRDITRDQQIEAAQAQVDQARANLDAAQAVYDTLLSIPRDYEMRAVEAGVDAAASFVDQIIDQIARQSLFSPIDGVVLQHLMLEGEFALPGAPIVSIADLSVLELTAYIPEAELNNVAIGVIVDIKVDAYPDRFYSGEITYIADEAEFTPRNIQTPDDRVIMVYAVRIRVPNPDGTLKPGLPADVIIRGEG